LCSSGNACIFSVAANDFNMNDIAKSIQEKIGQPHLLNDLDKKLSASDLSSLLLELFRMKAATTNPAEVLRQFDTSRFAIPSSVDAIEFKELEIKWLKQAKKKNFVPVTLSPLTPLGTCSALGFVDQNNVVSTVRGMELISDATNVMALLIAREYKLHDQKTTLRYATTHRHVRCQALKDPRHTAHFGLFGLVTGGMDTGNYSFELEHLFEHLELHLSLLSTHFPKENLWGIIQLKEDNESFRSKMLERMRSFDNSFTVKVENTYNTGEYYHLVRFRTYLHMNGQDLNLSDGGFVDWTQKLLTNKKHRMIASATGLELVHKLMNSV
jgi:hypothetical protein